MLKKVVVLNPHPFYQPYALERSVAARFGASFHADGPPDDDLLAATTVLLTHQAPIDRAMLERLPSCRMIVSYSTGLDHMDLEAAAERGILARGIAGYCTEDVAEHALAMILSCARRLHTLDRAMRDHGAWDVTVEACGELPCGGGGQTCPAGQICRERSSGAQIVECVDNPCGDAALTCDCAAELCFEGDTCSVSDLTLQCNSNCNKCP